MSGMITKGTVWKAVKIGTLSFFGAQAAAIVAVTAVDEMRKRRNPTVGEFPHVVPQDSTLSAPEGEEPTDLRVYTYGSHLYADLLEAINKAKRQIFFEWFIMKADETGWTFRKALIDAAERGVEVYIILDTWGNGNQDPRFRYYPDHPNIHVLRFPFIRPGLITGIERDKGRDHRKLLCVDSEVGFVGGYNIGNLYAKHWRDTHARITGPLVWELEKSFTDMWNEYRKRYHPVLPDLPARQWNPALRAVQNSPATSSFPVRTMYLDMLDRATTRAWITMGYFIPDSAMLRAMVNAAQRGVDVRVLIPQYSNHIVADWVGRPYYSELLRAGVKIFLYEQAMVHAKTMTIDSKWSTIGTANLDRMSMRGNFEVNIEIFDADVAATMERIFEVDLTNAHELIPEVWEQRSGWARLAERVLKPLGPLL